MDLLTVLRYANIALAATLGTHLAITSLSSRFAPPWSRGQPASRFLRLGTGAVLLTLAYGTRHALTTAVPPSETTWLLTVGLLWMLGGTLWPYLIRAREAVSRRRASRLPARGQRSRVA